jgi:hypothetical protein
MNANESRNFIEKSHLDLSVEEYGHFKFIPGMNLRELINAYEQKGEGEKVTMQKLSSFIETYDKEL